MANVMVVTDSTSSIPTELMNGNPIKVLPLHVIWGEQLLKDGIDITPTEFYERLVKDPINPSTTQITPEEFKLEYNDLVKKGFDILSIHISADLSGTMDSAIQAKRAMKNANIELVDSRSASMAMGFQVLRAAQMAKMGATLAECKAVALQSMEHSGVYFALNTLEYLRRGGRINGAAAFLGHLLDLKPLLELRDGKIEAVERVRTLSKTIDRLLDLVEAKIENSSGPIRLCAIHGNAPEQAEQLLNRAVKRFSSAQIADAVITSVGPVLGTHTGPGALGMAYMSGI